MMRNEFRLRVCRFIYRFLPHPLHISRIVRETLSRNHPEMSVRVKNFSIAVSNDNFLNVSEKPSISGFSCSHGICRNYTR